jgi:DNA gyrase subunit A
MRAGQPFSMRYPLVEVEGSYGTLLETGSWSAPRYTSARLSSLANYLFKDLDKEVIEEWRDNYDNTEQYPMVLPTKGYYNIVNGTFGVGVGASASIPQFNLKEVNEALIKLLWTPGISFDEIYCVPDFATGAILLNEAQVKESLKKGTGFACKLRSVVDWDAKERCLIVSEIPYSVYTNTICKELNQILDSEGNPGIERFNDLTGKTPLIKIYLTKAANPERVLRYLYKNTSLQSHYSINMTMLEDGRFPKVYGWREALQAHIDHEKTVYRRGFEYDLKKIDARLLIIEGLLKAISCIDEVVATIKKSSSSGEANLALQKLLSINETQAKAILDIKLSRLTKLDVSKLENEKKTLEAEKERITLILEDEFLFKKEIEKGLREVALKFGDARRTQVLDLQIDPDDEVIEEKRIIISLTNYNNLYVNEASTLLARGRRAAGDKLKLSDGEYVVETITDVNTGTLMLFSNFGRFFNYPLINLDAEKINLYDILNLKEGEVIKNLSTYSRLKDKKYVVFVTKQGYVKKTLLTEYLGRKTGGAQGIKLRDNDELVSISFMNDGILGLLASNGQFTAFNVNEVSSMGRIAMGVIGMRLVDGETVVDAHPLGESKEIISISKLGWISRTARTDLSIIARGGKGIKLQKLHDDDAMVAFCCITDEPELLITSRHAATRCKTNAVLTTGRGAMGSMTLKLKSYDKVITVAPLEN